MQLPIQRKHWIAVRQIDNVYYNFDSKLDKPKQIGAPDELLDYLREEIKNSEQQLLVVAEKSVPVELLWKTEQKKTSDEPSDNGSTGNDIPDKDATNS